MIHYKDCNVVGNWCLCEKLSIAHERITTLESQLAARDKDVGTLVKALETARDNLNPCLLDFKGSCGNCGPCMTRDMIARYFAPRPATDEGNGK